MEGWTSSRVERVLLTSGMEGDVGGHVEVRIRAWGRQVDLAGGVEV